MSAELVDGDYRVDASELHRVCQFKVERNDAATLQNNERQQQHIDIATIEELASLRTEVKILRDLTDDYKKRLDRETDERMRLTRLLEHQTEKHVTETVSGAVETVKTSDDAHEQVQTVKKRRSWLFWVI